MKQLFLILILAFAKPLSAQISNVHKPSGEPLRQSVLDKTEGSPYFGEGIWAEGELVDTTGTRFLNIELRYNAYEDKLEVKTAETVLVVYENSIASFALELPKNSGNAGRKLFKTGYKSDEFDRTTNFRIIYESEKVSLLERVRKIRINVTPPSYGERNYEKYVPENSTYIITREGMRKIKMNQRGLMNAFQSHKSQIKKFLSTNNIDLQNEQDLFNTLKYISSIVE